MLTDQRELKLSLKNQMLDAHLPVYRHPQSNNEVLPTENLVKDKGVQFKSLTFLLNQIPIAIKQYQACVGQQTVCRQLEYIDHY